MALTIEDVLLRFHVDWDTRQIGVGTTQINELGGAAKVAGLQFAGMAKALAGMAVATGATAAVIGIVVGLKDATQAAIDFEAGMAGVKRTVTDLSETEFANLTQGFRDMAKEIPIAVDELTKMGQQAGQLGIAGKDILEFTRTVAMLASTTNLSAEEAGNALARIANIMGTSADKFKNIGAVILDLGQKSAATETQIVEFGLRLAGWGKQIGLSEDQVLAFGTAMAGVGIQAEAGGTAMSKVFQEMDKAVGLGSEKLKEFAKVAGLSVKEFSDLFRKDASEAVTRFIEGIGKIKEAGGNVSIQLNKMHLDARRLGDTIVRLAGAGGLLRNTLIEGAKAMKEGTALTNAFNIRNEAADKQIQLLKNSVHDLAIEFGIPFKDAIADAAKSLREIFSENQATFKELAKDVGESAKSMGILAKAAAEVLGPFAAFVDLVLKLNSIVSPTKMLDALAQRMEEMAAKGATLEDIFPTKPKEPLGQVGDTKGLNRAQADSLRNWATYQKEWMAIVNKNAPTTEKLRQEYDKWADATARLANGQKDAGDETDKLDKKQQKLADDFHAQLAPLGALEDKYRELATIGVTFDDFVKANSENIMKAAEAQLKNNETIDAFGQKMLTAARNVDRYIVANDGGIKSVRDFTISTSELNDQYELLDGAISDIIDPQRKYTAVAQNLAKVHLEQAAAALKASISVREYQDTLEKLLVQAGLVADLIGGKLGDAMARFIVIMGDPLSTATRKITASIGLIGAGLTEMSGQFEGTFKTIISAAGAFATAFEKAMDANLGVIKSFVIAASQALSSIVDSMAKSVEAKKGAAIGSIIGGIAGSFFGPLGTIIGTALGKAVGAFIGSLFAKDWAAEVKKTTEQLYGFVGALGLSASFMEKFTEAVKKSGDAVVTLQLMLKDVIDDLGGITKLNADEIFKLAADLISSFDAGKISAKEFADAFGKAFMDLANFAMKYGGIYMDQLKKMIADTERLGATVPEITQFLSDQLDALVANVNKFASNFEDVITKFTGRAEARFKEFYDHLTDVQKKAIDDMTDKARADLISTFLTSGEMAVIQQRWEKLAMFITATMIEMQKQGRTMAEILQQLGPSIETLLDTADRLGILVKKGGAFEKLLQFLHMFQDNAKQFEHLDFMSNILKQLDLFGALGPKFIGDFFGQIKKLFADMLGFVGGDWSKKLGEFLNKPFKKWNDDQKAAFQSIIPYILQAADYYRRMGLPLPPILQHLLDIAKANGYINDSMPATDPLDNILKVLMAIYTAMTGLVLVLDDGTTGWTAMGEAAKKAGAAAEGAWSWAKDIHVGAGDVNKNPVGDGHKQGLLDFYRVERKAERLIVHQGETVIGAARSDSMMRRSRRGAGGSIIINIIGGDPMQIKNTIIKLQNDGYL